MIENYIINYFKPILVTRSLDLGLPISNENKFTLTRVGLPNGILDFQFTENIYLISNYELLIGKNISEDYIVLNIESGNILKRSNQCFLAESLDDFIKQLFTYDYLWNVVVKMALLGDYRDNHKKYAFFLETELLKINDKLLENDNCYFWGSLIEDIEFGIVG